MYSDCKITTFFRVHNFVVHKVVNFLSFLYYTTQNQYYTSTQIVSAIRLFPPSNRDAAGRESAPKYVLGQFHSHVFGVLDGIGSDNFHLYPFLQSFGDFFQHFLLRIVVTVIGNVETVYRGALFRVFLTHLPRHHRRAIAVLRIFHSI